MVSSHVFVIRSGYGRSCIPFAGMSKSGKEPHTDDHGVAIARLDDEDGTFKPFPSTTSSGTSLSWFVPPIVIPLFLMMLIMISFLHQRPWQFPG